MEKKYIFLFFLISSVIGIILYLWLHDNTPKEYLVRIDLGDGKYSILKGSVDVDAIIKDEHNKDQCNRYPAV